jgi:hypothetical protein
MLQTCWRKKASASAFLYKSLQLEEPGYACHFPTAFEVLQALPLLSDKQSKG